MAFITGTAGDDALAGTSAADTIKGLGGYDVLKGGDGNDRLEGGEGKDKLYGEAGDDLLIGGAGDDTYFIDGIADRIQELGGEGIDRVYSSVDFTLAGQSLEHLTLTGTASADATGNGGENILRGNRAANRIDGGVGADTMAGGGSNDTYVVDNRGDVVTELAGEGNDLVLSSVSFTLGENVERLTLTGDQAIRATGNALANTLIGNYAANEINGGAGADVMRGGGGNDVYKVDDVRDLIVESSGNGTDSVLSWVSYTLPSYVEHLTLAGTAAISGAGNGSSNRITGNGAANVLNGGIGADVLTGGAGADTFAFTTALSSANADRVTDLVVAEDRILLGGAAGQPFAALASGSLGSAAFRVGAAAADATDRIVYDRTTGVLLYDADGSGAGAAVKIASLGTGLALSANSFVVSGPANQLPTISSGTTASVNEGVSTSTIVYQTQASDADGDRISYLLSGTDAGAFRIDQSGAVRFVSSPDYDTKSSYSFTVKAVDSSGSGSSRAVTVSVAEVQTQLRVVNETTAANDSSGSAQPLARSLFSASEDTNLTNPALPSLRISGSVSSTTDRDFFSVSLKAGELLILDVDGTVTLDSFLRVFSPGGTLLASNDDLGSFDAGSKPHDGVAHNMDSYISLRAPSSGTYTFSIQSFADQGGGTSSGAYKLNVSVGPPAPQAQIHSENAATLLSGDKWSTLSLTYGFTTDAGDYSGGEGSQEIAGGMAPLNSQQQAAVRMIVGEISKVTNLSFSEAASSPGSALLRYALSGEPETAHAYYPGPGDGGDSWYNRTEYSSPVRGNYEFATFIHETGHALGLKHAHESPALSTAHDSLEFSIMTYRSYIGATVGEGGGYTNETYGFPQTMMMYDIAALQMMYGADFTTNAGNSVYSWSPSSGAFRINGTTQWTSGANRVFMTLWDGGGEDTYDLSAYSGGVKIDLRPGAWVTTSSVQVANLGDGHYARGNIANALQYRDDPRSLIENAKGGAGADTITANAAVNDLTGGGGRDIFRWASTDSVGVGSRADHVLDFKSAEDDRIDLSALDAKSGTTTNDAFVFIGKGSFTNSAGQLRYEVRDGDAHVFADRNGDGAADIQIVLHNVITLSSGDFIF